MSAFVLVMIILLGCCGLALWLQGRRARSFLGRLPCYSTLPLLGNVHQLLGDGEYIFNLICQMSKISDEKMLPFVLWMGPLPIVLMSEAEDVKSVTNAFIEKPYFYNFGRDYAGNGLVTAPGVIWKHSIKKLAGTFSTNIVDGYQDMFNSMAAKLVGKLRGEVGGEPFDVMHKYLSYITLETICQTALGMPKSTGDIITKEYYASFTRTLELFLERGLNIVLHSDRIYRLTAGYRELKKCVAILHNFSDTLIKNRRKERDEMKKEGMLSESENVKSRFKSFLDILLDLEEHDPTLTPEQIQNEVDTVIVGGQDTVATTTFISLLMIGCKPHVQEKLCKELQDIFGGSKRPIDKDDLSRMVYLDAIIHETLRMYPPIPIIFRDADRDLQLKSCIIPKGTVCGVNGWAAGRSKSVWGPDSEEYRPERWLENGLTTANAAYFLAFSYGKRACIGKKYAIPFLKTVLASVIRELVVESEADNIKFKVDISLRAVSGHLIRVHEREA